jgi:hypothetical protein
MKRRRVVRVVTLILIGLIGLASVAIVRGRSIDIVDMDGRPIAGAFLLYHREGARLSVAHPVTYVDTPYTLVRSDERGRASIPAVVRVHWPWPLESHPRVIVDFVYARRVHNGLANVRAGNGAKPGVFELTGDHLRLADVSRDPALWHGSLRDGAYFLPNAMGRIGRLAPTADTMRAADQLLDELIADYGAFLEQYQHVARPRPEMPAFARYGTDDDKRKWRENVEQDLAREPTWGPVAQREIGRQLRAYRAP